MEKPRDRDSGKKKIERQNKQNEQSEDKETTGERDSRTTEKQSEKIKATVSENPTDNGSGRSSQESQRENKTKDTNQCRDGDVGSECKKGDKEEAVGNVGSDNARENQLNEDPREPENVNNEDPLMSEDYSLGNQPDNFTATTWEDPRTNIFDSEESATDPLKLDDAACHSNVRNLTKLRHSGATEYVPCDTGPISNPFMKKTLTATFHKLQQMQEQRVNLNIGGQIFQTSIPTLRAEANSLFGLIFLPNCSMRPYGRDTYYFERNPAHFRIILNYLRQCGHLDRDLLPHEKSYFLELILHAERVGAYCSGKTQRALRFR